MLQLTTVLFLIAGSILAVVHAIALKVYLYWSFWWFDLPMHFLGGIVMALLVFTLFDLKVFPRSILKFYKVMLFVLLAALVWEVYEYLYVIIPEDDYLIDTAIDLVMGMLGGYVGYLVACNIRKI